MAEPKGAIQKWGEKINWDRRVKAVCKPCWELKYCPYGPLVEDFPIKKERDSKSCIIFGHDCPVFYACEPLTETKELRNISRTIPQKVKFRVLKRDNQICRICGQAVKDEEVEFDHIIPCSKGGSSDEYNVMLLCKSCNRKKGKSFENQYLVKSFSEHIIQPEPAPIILLLVLIEFIKLSHKLHNEEGRMVTPKDICRLFGRRKEKYEDKRAVDLIFEIEGFFNTPRPKDIPQKQFKILQFRWGYPAREFHSLKDVSLKFKVDIDELINFEDSFFIRLGYPIKINSTNRKRWSKT